jgi:hypothetical protein
MSHLRTFCFRSPRLPAAAVLLALWAAGCGDAGVGRTLPVAGQVTLDGGPLTAASTVILFKPDPAKGNASPFEPAGTVDDRGNYTLATKGKKGAPPGWYKVIVTASEPRADAVKGRRQQRPAPKSLVPARYGQAETTPVLIEVVENPASGAYDLKLTSG